MGIELKLTSPKYGEKTVLIDKDDYEMVSKYHWNVTYVRGNWYVTGHLYQGVGKWRQIKLHRLIMGVIDTPKIHIDHKDGDGLNNRKDNLRKATIAQNSRNVGATKRSSTGFRGVSLYRTGSLAGKYSVHINDNGKHVFGGYFTNPIDAAKKYNELALKYHGEFGYQNIIPK